jgi:TRAP-type C4-dicarboxylate transport system permease small subunit
MRLVRVNKKLNTFINNALIWVTAFLALDVLWGVISRFLLQSQSPWTEELARFLLVWMALLGIASVFRQQQHLGINILVQKFESSIQHWAIIAKNIIIILFVILIFINGGIKVAWNSFIMDQQLVALPFAKYWLYAMLPLAGVIILLFSIEELLTFIYNDDKNQTGESN